MHGDPSCSLQFVGRPSIADAFGGVAILAKSRIRARRRHTQYTHSRALHRGQIRSIVAWKTPFGPDAPPTGSTADTAASDFIRAKPPFILPAFHGPHHQAVVALRRRCRGLLAAIVVSGSSGMPAPWQPKSIVLPGSAAMRQSVYSTETLGAGSLSCFRLCFADRRTLRTTLRTASPPDFVCIPLRQRRHPQNFMCLGMRELPIACQRDGQAVNEHESANG